MQICGRRIANSPGFYKTPPRGRSSLPLFRRPLLFRAYCRLGYWYYQLIVFYKRVVQDFHRHSSDGKISPVGTYYDRTSQSNVVGNHFGSYCLKFTAKFKLNLSYRTDTATHQRSYKTDPTEPVALFDEVVK